MKIKSSAFGGKNPAFGITTNEVLDNKKAKKSIQLKAAKARKKRKKKKK